MSYSLTIFQQSSLNHGGLAAAFAAESFIKFLAYGADIHGITHKYILAYALLNRQKP